MLYLSKFSSNILKVSVIIPVYNTSQFVVQAIDSALRQMEVVEVIAVDDGSTDNSLQILRDCAARDERVKVFRHRGGKNLGAAATRNIGLEKATADYIAFLDSDDYWIANRFEKTREIFNAHPDADGVYEARAAESWSGDPESSDLSMLRNNPPPEDVFYNMSPFGRNGIITLVGLTVKRGVVEKIGYFSPRLRLAQDTHWLTKLSIKCRLYGGEVLRPVAIRRFHSHNATRNVELHKKMKVEVGWLLLKWATQEKLPSDVIHIILKVLLRYHFENNNSSQRPRWIKKKNDFNLLLRLWFLKPELYTYPELRYFRNLVLRLSLEGTKNFYR